MTRTAEASAPRLKLTAGHHRNHTSQCGEDGVVEAIFRHLGIDSGAAVEFGAWDGVRFSNTHALLERGWRIILIEGEESRFRALSDSMTAWANATAVHAWVSPDGPNSLDAILARSGITEVDFLSVDIDGDDYHVLATLAANPKVICVEFNPSMPPPLAIIGRLGKSEGSSLVAFDQLMTTKGYALVHATKWNAFFVRGDLSHRFVGTTPAEAFDYRSARYVISFFNGGNRIVNAGGNRARAKNQWSKARAAISLPRRRTTIAGLAVAWAIAAFVYWA